MSKAPENDDPAKRNSVTPESAEPEPAQAGKAQRRDKPPRTGRVFATLALLLALAALGGSGYLYYELLYRTPAIDDTESYLRLQRDVDAGLERIEQLAARVTDDRQNLLAEFEQRQRAAERAADERLQEALTQLAHQAPPSAGEWERAEIRYLLRIANHRLLMERDAAGALSLLRSADAMLEEQDDFALHPVRERLADEILALKNLQRVDLSGTFLRLEALKRDLPQLPLRLPEYPAPEAPAAPQPAGIREALTGTLARYVQVRRFDGSARPLLAPEQSVYLELNLGLMLERAQLAALRRDQLVYDESIAATREWIEAYLDPDARPVRRALAELEELADVVLEQQLPSISGSLNALDALLRQEP